MGIKTYVSTLSDTIFQCLANPFGTLSSQDVSVDDSPDV